MPNPTLTVVGLPDREAGNDRNTFCVVSVEPAIMRTFLHRVVIRFEAFEAWFSRHFGWFFTNGMKQGRADEALKDVPSRGG